MVNIDEQIEKTQAQIKQLENNRKELMTKKSNQERNARTKRLIERGAILEGVIGNAEGRNTIASATYGAHTEGYKTKAINFTAHSENNCTTAECPSSHAEGDTTTAKGKASHTEGNNTIAVGNASHVEGRYNIADTTNTYVHIVGNGNTSKRSNAHTIDWNGNGWFKGSVEGTALILKSSTTNSNKRFKITINDSGQIIAAQI